MGKQVLRSLMLALLLSGGAVVVVADEMDRVRQLRDSNAILPLTKILSEVENRYPGTLLDVELEEEMEEGRKLVIYEVEMLGRDHVIRTIRVDARSGRMLGPERD